MITMKKLITVGLLFVLSGIYAQEESAEKVIAKLPQTITTANYEIKSCGKGGSRPLNVYVNGKILLSNYYLQRWIKTNRTEIKGSTSISEDGMVVTAKSTFLWNQGKVEEVEEFTNTSIKLTYTYTLLADKKKTSNINIYTYLNKDIPLPDILMQPLNSQKMVPLQKEGKLPIRLSMLTVKNFQKKDIEIITEGDCQFYPYFKNKEQMTMGVEDVKKYFRRKGEKHIVTMLIDFAPAKGTKELPDQKIKVIYKR
jgi:hypothetical protein